LTVAGLALRASQLHQSLGGDEIWTYQDVVGRSLRAVLSTVHVGGENSPPLFFVFAWAAQHLGNPSIWIRLPSVLAGAATVPAVYLLGRVTVGRTAGLVGAGIMALAPFAVFYGIEARAYATMVLCVTVSTFALANAIRPGSRSAWWVLYALAAAGAAYSHYTSVFVLAAQAIWSLWVSRRRIGRALGANAAILVIYSPWLPHVRGKALVTIGQIYPLRLGRVLTDLLRPIPGHPGAPLRAIPTILGLIVFGVCVLAGVGALARAAMHAPAPRRRDPLTPGLPAVLVLAVVTPVGILMYSLLGVDIWLPRNLSASMPAAALVVGASLAALPRRLTAVAAALVAIVLLAGTLRSFDPNYNRGPFRSIAAELDRLAAPQDPIVLVTYAGQLATREQLRRPHLIVPTLPDMWERTPVGHRAYLVLDKSFDEVFHLGTPQHAGFRLVSRQVHTGALPTSVLIYERVSVGRG
jgi:mannosyltransferase